MTAAVEDEGRGRSDPAPTGRVRAPLWVHALLLGVVLVAMLPVFGSGGRFMSDEGAALAQAEALRDGGWGLENRAPDLDPDMTWWPFAKSVVDGSVGVPYPKKPVYPVLVSGALEVGGVPAAVLLSLAGLLGAAVLAALLAEELRPTAGRWALWICAVSPLVVDGYLVMAHTLGAAAAAGATLAAVRARERRTWPRLAAVVGCVIVLVLLRREGLLFVGALALVMGVSWRRDRRRPGLVVAATALAAGALTVVADSILTARWLPDGRLHLDVAAEEVAGSGLGGLVSARVEGVVTTLLEPGYAGGRAAALLWVAALLGLILVVVATSETPRPRVEAALAAALAAVVLLRWAEVRDAPDVVSGILPAFPLGVWAIVALFRRRALGPVPAELLAVVVTFGAGLVATQYRNGGAYEWGWRFFAPAVPLVCVLVALGLVALWADHRHRATVVVLVGSSAVVTFGGLDAVREVADRNAAFEQAVEAAAASTEPGDGGVPVVVTTEEFAPRLFWRSTLDGPRWFALAGPDGLPDVVDRLRDQGIREVLLVTQEGPAAQRLLDDTVGWGPTAVGRPLDGELWAVTVGLDPPQ